MIMRKKLLPKVFITFLFLSFLINTSAQINKKAFENFNKQKIKTGVLYDQVTPLSGIENYSGTSKTKQLNIGKWRQIYHELNNASFNKKALLNMSALKKQVKKDLRNRILTVGIIDYKYNQLKENAVEKGLIKLENDKYIELAEDIYDTKQVFATSIIDTRKYTSENNVVKFQFSDKYYFSNTNKKPSYLKVDFGNNANFQNVKLNQIVNVTYSSEGEKTIKVIAVYNDGSQLQSSFKTKVNNTKAPAASEHLSNYTADIAFNGTAGVGEVGIFFGNGNSEFTRPVIMMDGFDPGDSRNFDALYDMINQQDIVTNFREIGYDLAIMNFYGGADYIQRNAYIVVKLVQEINARMTAAGTMKEANQIILVGPSMGGLISRYAINYMEANGIEHNIRTFISFDSPQKGANIPLGLQHWLKFFAAESDGAQEGLDQVNTPAARQMLLYHHYGTSGSTAGPSSYRPTFLSDIGEDFPTECRNVSVINGSGYGTLQSKNGNTLEAGDEIIHWHYESWLVDIDGNSWAVPNQTSQRIFEGELNKLGPGYDEEDIYVNNTRPYDGAPGGFYNAIQTVHTTDPGYGDITSNFDVHDFIPTISGFALEGVTDPNYNIDANIDDIQTPFDKLYYPSENQQHVTITPESYNWFYHEIFNYAPEFTSTAITEINVNEAYNYFVTFTDQNEWNTVNLTVTDLPAWLTFNETNNTFTGTPTVAGNYNVSITLTDGLDQSIQAFTITVNGGTVDTEAPTVPTNLTSENISTTTVDLSWTASTDNVGVTAYDVYQDATFYATVAGTSANITALSEATSYSFYVIAKDAAGNESAQSNTINITTQEELDTEVPTAPTDLTSANITETTVDLSWTASTDNVGVTAYDVYQNAALYSTVTGTSVYVSGLTEATDYTFYVVAKDAAGNNSTQSNTVNVTTSTTPGGSCYTSAVTLSLTLDNYPSETSWSLTNTAGETVASSNGYSDKGATVTQVFNLSNDDYTFTINDSYGDGICCAYGNGSYSLTDANSDEIVSGGNFASSEATNFCISGSITPPPSGGDMPEGYCASNGNNSSYEWIDLVRLGTIDNTTGDDGGYADYTSMSTNLAASTEYTIYISAGFSSSDYTEFWHVWIDYNRDGDFNDAGEEVVSGSSSSSATLSGTFTTPSTMSDGTTKMRVTMKYNSSATTCESFTYGEVEDYAVNLGNGAVETKGNYTFAEKLGTELPSYTLFPVPTKDFVNVKTSSNANLHITVYNSLGAVVKSEILNGTNKLDVSDLLPGVYTIKVFDGNKQTIKKIVKE